MNKYICPDTDDFVVMGNTYSSIQKDFEIKINRWSGSSCKTDAEIDAEMENTNINILMVNSYFDFDDYDEPVKTYLDDNLKFSLLPGYQIMSVLLIMENTIERQDGFFSYTQSGEEDTFISYNRVLDQLKTYDSSDSNVFSKSSTI